MSEHVRKSIEEAFAKARDQGPMTTSKQPAAQHCDLKTIKSHYTETDSHLFHRRADAFITAAVHSPHVKLHRQSQQWWLGDFDRDPLPSADALIKQATEK